MRSTVVGSYPRVGDSFPGQRLRRTIARRERGEATGEELRAVELDVLQEGVREQAASGIDVVTDGQVTWPDAVSHFASRLGMEIGGLTRYFDTNTYYRRPRVAGPIRWSGPITVDDWTAASAASPVPVKAVLTGPWTLAALSSGIQDLADAMRAIATALSMEVEALVRAGAAHIQIDEPALVRMQELPPGYRDIADILLAAKGNARTMLATYFGGVPSLLPELMELPFDVLALDLVQGADTEDALRRVDADKGIAFGLVDARNTRLESPGEVALRVRGFADCVDLDRSFVSPSNGLEFLPRARAREKLEVVAAAAREVA